MLRAILTFWSWAATGAGAAWMAAWAFGRIVTDSLGWSQYVYWIPSPAAMAMVAFALAVGGAAGWAARRLPPKLDRTPARRTRLVLWLGWAGMLAFTLGAEWHAARYVSPVDPPPGKSFRVLFWNSEVERLDNFDERVQSQKPDIAVISNAPRRADWQKLREGFADSTSALRSGRFTIVSRFPLLRWGWTDLNIRGPRPRVFTWKGGGNIGFDTGQALFAELDTSAMTGCTTMIWVLDLPSDPELERLDILGQTAAKIAGFAGPEYQRTPAGLDQVEPEAPKGFPTPDLVLGDFNTPRGSSSLKLITGGMPHAFDQAGRGFAATWPRRFPVIAIDQAFVGPHLHAASYRIVDLGAAQHRAEVIELVRAPDR